MTDLFNNFYKAPINKSIIFILSQKDINITDNYGENLLHYSCYRKDGIPLVELLLFLEIKIDRKNNDNRTAMDLA